MKTFTPEQKQQIVQTVRQTHKQGHSIQEACKAQRITPEQYYRWTKQVTGQRGNIRFAAGRPQTQAATQTGLSALEQEAIIKWVAFGTAPQLRNRIVKASLAHSELGMALAGSAT